MIYFDDELPPLIKPPLTAAQRWMRRLFTTFIVLLIFFWLSLKILTNIGGNDPALRSGLESYLSNATGYKAHIGNFNGLTFYPALSLDIADVEFSQPDPIPGKSQLNGPPVAHIGTLKISMGFWDMFFGRNRLRTLEITQLNFGRTLGLVRPLVIDKAILEKVDATANISDNAWLHVAGHYGDDPFTAWQSMHLLLPPPNSGGAPVFLRSSQTPFMLDMPFLALRGNFSAVKKGTANLQFEKIGTPEKILTGQLILQRSNSKGYDLNGQLIRGESRVLFKMQEMPQGMIRNFDTSQLDRGDLPAFQKFANAIKLIDPEISNSLLHALPLNTVP